MPNFIGTEANATHQAPLALYDVTCQLYQHTGTVDLVRHANTSTWTPSAGNFVEDHTDLPLFMADLQEFPNFESPVPGMMPGVGGTLAASTNVTSTASAVDKTNDNDIEDFDSFAKNYFDVEGEARRIAYEVAQSAPRQQGISYRVHSAGLALRYQIMFVPWILLVGLFTMALAGVCIITLIFLARRSINSRMGRVISPVRLIADAVAGLSKEEFQEVSHLADDELDQWSKRFKVHYDMANDEGVPRLTYVGAVASLSHEED